MNHLYVCHFSNGHIKVGRSIDPQARIASHEARVSCLGVELVESSVFECVAGSAGPEAALIQKCREYASANHKSEWFAGLDFDNVCQWAREFATGEVAGDAGPTSLYEYLTQVGTQTKLAVALGVSPAQVWQWKQGRRPVPAEYAAQIEAETHGRITRKQMFPESWARIWPELTEEQEA